MSAKATPKPMTRKVFFAHLEDAVRAGLPDGLQHYSARQTMNLLKVRYGENYRIHFEVSIMAEVKLVELGLHFEDGPQSTDRLLRHFERYIFEIKDLLGEQVELERWTRSWGHIYEVHPFEIPSVGLAQQLAQRLCVYIITLQPLLEEAYELGLVPRQPHASTFHTRFRGRR